MTLNHLPECYSFGKKCSDDGCDGYGHWWTCPHAHCICAALRLCELRIRNDERARNNEPLHSLTEVARLRGVSRQRVQQMVASGELPAIRVGNTWAVRGSDATP